MFKILTYGIIAIIVVIVIGVIVIRNSQRKRIEEARMRGIKEALKEQKQYDTLRKLEGRDKEGTKLRDDYTITTGRREIKR